MFGLVPDIAWKFLFLMIQHHHFLDVTESSCDGLTVAIINAKPQCFHNDMGSSTSINKENSCDKELEKCGEKKRNSLKWEIIFKIKC